LPFYDLLDLLVVAWLYGLFALFTAAKSLCRVNKKD
jgi:hypothetical protein